MAFIALFVALQYYSIKIGVFSAEILIINLLISASAYIFVSVFGFISNFIAFIVIAIIILFVFASLPYDLTFWESALELVTLDFWRDANLPWLTDRMTILLILIVFSYLLYRDIFGIKKSMSDSKKIDVDNAIMSPKRAYKNDYKSRDMKLNNQSVLQLSNMLEKEWGRKPSNNEVLYYISSLFIKDDNNSS